MLVALIILSIVVLILAGAMAGLVIYLFDLKSAKKRFKTYASKLEKEIEKQRLAHEKLQTKFETVSEQRDSATQMLELVVPMLPEQDKEHEPKMAPPENESNDDSATKLVAVEKEV